jgi:hypothetical protein
VATRAITSWEDMMELPEGVCEGDKQGAGGSFEAGGWGWRAYTYSKTG